MGLALSLSQQTEDRRWGQGFEEQTGSGSGSGLFTRGSDPHWEPEPNSNFEEQLVYGSGSGISKGGKVVDLNLKKNRIRIGTSKNNLDPDSTY